MIDIQTLLFNSCMARAGFILIFLIASFKSEARVAFRFWTCSIMASATGMLLLYSDPIYPKLPVGRGAAIYAIVGFSMSFLWAGVRVIFGRRVSPLCVLIMGILPGAVYGISHGIGIRFDLVLLLTLVTFASLAAVAARALLIRGGQHYLPSQLLVGCALAAYSIALAASAIVIAVQALTVGPKSELDTSSLNLSMLIDQLMSVLTYVGLVSMSLEQAQVRIKALATTDPLTCLPNRRGIEARMQTLIGACQRAKQPMALLIVDLDHFKSINDHYGHNSGDAVLKAFATRLSLHFPRKQDVTGRWGGEEFLAMLSNVTLEQAVGVAEKLCARVAEEPFDVGDQTIMVTVSIGVAAVDIGTVSIEQAVKAADEALYEAKRNGRNQVFEASGVFGRLPLVSRSTDDGQIFTRGPRTRGSDDERAPGGLPFGMGRDGIDCPQDRMHDENALPPGPRRYAAPEESGERILAQ